MRGALFEKQLFCKAPRKTRERKKKCLCTIRIPFSSCLPPHDITAAIRLGGIQAYFVLSAAAASGAHRQDSPGQADLC